LFDLGFVGAAVSAGRATGTTAGSRSWSGSTAAPGLDLVQCKSFSVSWRHRYFDRNFTARSDSIEPVWCGRRMADGNRVRSYKRQSSKYKFTFLVCLGVVLATHISSEHVDLCISKRNRLAICLFHHHLTTKFSRLRESGH